MIKYPRTFHLPFSPGATNDDKILSSVEQFIGQDIVVTEKVDGSNVSMDSSGCYSRATKNPTHVSFDAFKSFYAKIKYVLNPEYQYFGEWCYAKHSIEYTSLPDYFLLFGIYSPPNWLSWQDTTNHWKSLGEKLGVDVFTVPVLFRGVTTTTKQFEQLIKQLNYLESEIGTEKEGVVVRLASCFTQEYFSQSIGKFVRANHVQTDTHWKHQEIIRNSLKGHST